MVALDRLGMERTIGFVDFGPGLCCKMVPGQSDQTVAADHEHYFDRAIIEDVQSEAWNLAHKE